MKKTALVTGGGRGIGYAAAKRLGLDGFNVMIMSQSPRERHGERLAALEREGVVFDYIQGDISVKSDRERSVGETVRRFGGIHVLVNNAGVPPLERRDLLEMTEESFDRVVGINTKGNMFLTQLAALQMLSQPREGKKRGTIINISSISAETVSLNRGEYCVSKAGVSMLTKLYAARLAGDGIFVHEIRPGIISTDMTSGVSGKYDAMIGDGVFPVRRWGLPEDVANAVSALAGDLFLYTTGTHFDVDGGFGISRL